MLTEVLYHFGISRHEYYHRMIDFSQNIWLSGVVGFCVMLALGTSAFLATRRWGWKAAPLLLLSTLLVPLLAYTLVAEFLVYVDEAYGYVIHLSGIALLFLAPTIAGLVLGLVARRQRVNGN